MKNNDESGFTVEQLKAGAILMSNAIADYSKHINIKPEDSMDFRMNSLIMYTIGCLTSLWENENGKVMATLGEFIMHLSVNLKANRVTEDVS